MTTFGVIGVGSIASAIVTGLCEGLAEPPRVVLSPRGAVRSRDLAERMPSVRVASSNQGVVDDSDVVIVAVLPQQAEDVLGQLAFRAYQAVVSAVAGVSLAVLRRVVAPVTEVARGIPMPAVAHRTSATPVFPATAAARDLFDRLGGCVVVAEESAFDAVAAASATVAAHCRYLEAIARWLSAHGVRGPEARQYVASIFRELSAELDVPEPDFDAMATAHSTPGGLNEQFARHLAAAGAFAAVPTGLDAVLTRVTTPGPPAPLRPSTPRDYSGASETPRFTRGLDWRIA
ncbi:NAD(P)-binding domain-containing protein [Microbacterium sp.]|uniref:NAD(P)-binding domain-containing protein n=1 Tax=Microbacterium sp. TaxID=51671 RepID=UPI003A8C833A